MPNIIVEKIFFVNSLKIKNTAETPIITIHFNEYYEKF